MSARLRSLFTRRRSDESLVAHADRLEAGGDLAAAIDTLMEANRRDRDPAIEARLVGLRHRAGLAATRVGRAGDIAHAAGGPPSSPRIAPDALTPTAIEGAVASYGYAHVPGLVPMARAERLVADVDRAIAAAERVDAGTADAADAAWYDRFVPDEAVSRPTVWAASQARRHVLLFELCDLVTAVGLDAALRGYLGERPAVAFDKCTFRRIPPDLNPNADWHQDGAFLGTDIRVLNVWITLRACGVDAPTLEFVPRRFESLVETGTGGASFDWSVGPDTVAPFAARTPLERPAYGGGDALLFDEMFLHRTATDPSMTAPRYTVETWFFAPSTLPDRYVPVLI
jgi:hypothetical protein